PEVEGPTGAWDALTFGWKNLFDLSGTGAERPASPETAAPPSPIAPTVPTIAPQGFNFDRYGLLHLSAGTEAERPTAPAASAVAAPTSSTPEQPSLLRQFNDWRNRDGIAPR